MRIAYAGTPEFAVPALKSIIASVDYDLVCVITQPDRKSGRGRKIIESPIKTSANASNVQVFQPEKINESWSLDFIKSMKLDLLVVAAYGQIFSQSLLDIPKAGCINIHASLLPRWRGAAPIQNAILHGDKQTGVSIMQMCKAMDAGDIWLQKSELIEPTDTAQSLHDRLAAIGGSVITTAMSKVFKDKYSPLIQAQNEVTYCSKLQKKDGLVDWNEQNQVIYRKIRAFFPWPGSYTTFANRRLTIVRASLVENSDLNLQPGTIHSIDKYGIYVSTGAGSIRIEELIPEGGKKVTAMDFSNSNQLINHVLGL